MPLIPLAAFFLLVALIYSSVGFGGGSSYNALLVLSGVNYLAIPSISLTCNILVVSGGVYHYQRAGLLNFKALLPFISLSVPMAWLGGRLEISEATFSGLLGLALLVSGLQLLRRSFRGKKEARSGKLRPWVFGVPLGALIGLVSGMVGIGGGIFLAPLLYFLNWSEPRRIAAMASGFILVNSVAGLAGQLMKQGEWSPAAQWAASWPLFLAVMIGGQIGSRLGARVLPEKWIKRATGVLVIYVAFRLLLNWYAPGETG